MAELFNYLLLVVVALLVETSSAGKPKPPKLYSELQPQAEFSKSSVDVTIPSSNGSDHKFRVEFSSKPGKPGYCTEPGSEACLSWKSTAKLTVKRVEGGRYTVTLTSNMPAKICFKINGKHLYGGPIKNVYPQEKSDIENLPYITADMTRFKMVQAVTERYWYTSSGLNVRVNPEAPLFLKQDKKELCLVVNNTFPYTSDLPIHISYDTCIGSKNLREAVGCFFKNYEKPIPPVQVIGSPIWSTWVEFKRNVTQEKAIKFFNQIKSYNMRLSVMEIDDAWETCYGSQEFDLTKFPDPKSMVDIFHGEGYLSTLWVHPFIGPGCKSIDKYLPYLAKYPNGTVGETEWWNGKGARLINFNDPDAIEWYQQRLFKIQESYGFDSFKFDAGEAAYIPGMSIDEKLAQFNRPNQFTTNYVQSAAKFGTLAEVRVGSEAQDFKLMQRLQDTNSVWDAERWGLRSVIKSMLQLSLLGYGAILPDMIGGNCYENQPTKEMFIRWIQLNAFLPVIQFSLAPWYFDQETIDLSRKFTDLHYENKDRILKEFKDTSHPVINPIWWISPEDKTAQGIDNQFLLGETLLVAPVVEEGAVTRDIYLPAGTWKDVNTKKVITGPLWLKNYSAPLDTLPYFEAVKA